MSPWSCTMLMYWKTDSVVFLCFCVFVFLCFCVFVFLCFCVLFSRFVILIAGALSVVAIPS